MDISDYGSESSFGGDDDAMYGTGYSTPGSPVEEDPEQEFKIEVALSLDRAFKEGHSVDNAAVELKTLRMASNVDLARVREKVVEGVIGQIPVVEGDAARQRQEVTLVVDRWGRLFTAIGGWDSVQTILDLQVHRLDLDSNY